MRIRLDFTESLGTLKAARFGLWTGFAHFAIVTALTALWAVFGSVVHTRL